MIGMLGILSYCTRCYRVTLGSSSHAAPVVKMGNETQIIHSQLQMHKCWRHPHAETRCFVSVESLFALWILKISFLLGTNLLSHYIDSSIDFSGLFGFLFSCLATLAKLGINHFPHLRVIRAWIIIDIVFWFFKLPLTCSNLPGLKCLLVQIIQATTSQCKLPSVTWEKVTG